MGAATARSTRSCRGDRCAVWLSTSSDRGGSTDRDQAVIDALAAKGALAVGVDTDVYLARISPGHAACDQLVGDAEALSRQVQRQNGDIEYQFPILAGVGEGATLAGVVLAQAPRNTLAGAVSLDPTYSIVTDRPLCAGRPAAPYADGGFVYGPLDRLEGFWLVALTPAATISGRTHVDELHNAGMPVDIRNLSDSSPGEALAALVEPHLYQGSPGGVASLPLVDLPAARPKPLMAVVISGDGGWRDLDKTIAEDLQKDGISVVGWDSVRYFWHGQSPDQASADLAAILDAYTAKWGARKIALIGYSFGADILPFLYNRLPKRLQDRVVLTSLLAFASAADWGDHRFGLARGATQRSGDAGQTQDRANPGIPAAVFLWVGRKRQRLSRSRLARRTGHRHGRRAPLRRRLRRARKSILDGFLWRAGM